MTKKDQKHDDLQEKIKKAQQAAAEEENGEHGEPAQHSEGPDSASPGASEHIKKELEKMTELAKRTMADFQNFKRRQEEESKYMIVLANSRLIKSALPALDNLERAKQHAPKEAAEWIKGIEMAINQLQTAFTDSGLKKMECIGEKFNPDHHEALLQENGPADTIIEVLEDGYTLGDRVLRHAKVKIGNGE